MAEIPSYLQPNAPQAPETLQQVPQPSVNPDGTPHVDMSEANQPAEQVYDVRNKTTISIPHSELEVAVRSGLYAPLKAKEYVVNDSSGNTHAVDGINLKQSFDDGNTFASAEDSHKHLVQRKYGSGQEVTAAIEGVGRGLFPGVSDRGVQLGKDFNGNDITQEDLAGRAETNPISSTVGELAGTLLSPITKAFGAGAAITEKVAAKTLTSAAVKAGLTNKVAQAIISKVVPAAAGSAVEGAYFGAAHLLNEDALGTAQFNAENLMASVEQGALWGAAFGGGMSAVGIGAKASASAVAESGAGKYVAGKAADVGTYFNNTEKAAREFLGIKPGMARKLAEHDKEFMGDTIKWTQEVLGKNGSVAAEDMAGIGNATLDSNGKKIFGTYNKVDELGLKNNTSYVIKADDLKFKMASEIEDKILPGLRKVEGSADQIKATNKVINEILGSSVGENVQLTAKDLHDKLKEVSYRMNFDKPLTGLTLNQEMLRTQREVLRRELDNAVALAEKANPVEFAGASAELAALNRRYRTISSLKKALAAQADSVAMAAPISKSEMLVGGVAMGLHSPLAVAGIIGKKFLESDMLRKMQILGKIERAQQATSTALATGFKAIGKGAAATEPVILKSLVDSQVATELVNGKKVKPKDEQQAYRNIAKNAKFAAENPEQFLQGVNKYSSHLYAVAPQTSGALDNAALNAMVFLHSKAPKSTKSKGFFDAGKFDKASGAEMLKMRQRIDMITKPSKAIHLLGKGKLGAAHVETIKAVYPEMYSKMQAQAMNFLSSKDAAKLSYGQKLNMATLLDVQADESMHYSNVMGLQANFSSGDNQDAQGGAVNTTQGGLAKVDKASRMDMDTSNDS